jgi:hypothetical protein
MSTHARMPITFSLNDRTPITISQYFKTHHIIIIRSINWAAHLRNFCFYSLANPHVIYSEFFLSFFPQQEPSREFLRILFFPLKFLLACCSMQHTHAGASQVPSSQLPSARAHMQGQVGPTGRPPIVLARTEAGAIRGSGDHPQTYAASGRKFAVLKNWGRFTGFVGLHFSCFSPQKEF